MRSQGVKGSDVTMISWPTQRIRREWCRERQIPRILVVEPGQAPPVVIDTLEDWVRAPLEQADLNVRVTTLARRHRLYTEPYLDTDDTLVYRGRRVPPSPSQVALLRQLVRAFGEPVCRQRLFASLGLDGEAEGRRNLLDLHVGRLRRKLRPIGLNLRTVWGAGYVLEPLAAMDDLPFHGQREAT